MFVPVHVRLQIYFLLLDQFDIPIVASENVQRHVAATATAVLTPGGSPSPTRRPMQARVVGGWQWNVEAPGQAGSTPLPVHSVC